MKFLYILLFYFISSSATPNIGLVQTSYATKKQQLLAAPVSIHKLLLDYGSLGNVPRDMLPSEVEFEPVSKPEPRYGTLNRIEKTLVKKYGSYYKIPKRELKSGLGRYAHRYINKHKIPI